MSVLLRQRVLMLTPGSRVQLRVSRPAQGTDQSAASHQVLPVCHLPGTLSRLRAAERIGVTGRLSAAERIGITGRLTAAELIAKFGAIRAVRMCHLDLHYDRRGSRNANRHVTLSSSSARVHHQVEASGHDIRVSAVRRSQ